MIRCKGVFRPGTIMNRTFHIGIVLAMAVHLLCGCCWHHAHAFSPRIDSPLSVEATCPCEHHGHPHEGQPGDHGKEQGRCDEGPCTFMRPDSSGSSDFSADLQCLSLASCLPLLPQLSRIDTTDFVPSRFGTSISLHLLNQAFLL